MNAININRAYGLYMSAHRAQRVVLADIIHGFVKVVQPEDGSIEGLLLTPVNNNTARGGRRAGAG